MKFVSFLLFSFLLQMHNAKRIPTPQHVKRIPMKRTGPTWHIVNSASTKSLHQLLAFTEKSASNIGIGNPQQRFSVQLDTGSKGFWIFSKEYSSSDANYNILKEKHRLFDSNASSSYRLPDPQPYPELFRMPQGWAFGFRGNDHVTVLGNYLNTTFYGIIKANDQLVNDKYDGVLGLQYVPGEGNFISRLCVDKVKYETNHFAIYYNRVYDTEQDSGILVICHIDITKFNTSTMQWIKEAEPGTWKIRLESVRLYDSRGNVSLRAPILASLDTASNEILAPEADLNLFYDYLKPYFLGDPKTSEFNCEFDQSFPDIIFTINGKEYTINGFDYTYETQFDVTKNCALIIKKSPTDQWSLGAPFLRQYYTAFDMRTQQVGFAELLRKPLPY